MSTLRISLPQNVASPAQARRQVCLFAAEHDLLGQEGVALLVVSELVTNAVLHGAEPIHVCVSRHSDSLRIEVSDGDAHTSPIDPLRPRAYDEPGGRGMQIVNALSRGWGVTRHDDGKTVWAEVGLKTPGL